MRRVKIGNYVCEDNTPSTIFPSNCYHPLPEKDQVLNMEDFACESVEETRWSEEEEHLTKFFRSREKALGTCFQMSKLHQKPMLSMQDGFSMLLPLPEDGNSTGFDALTYRHPLYKDFIYALANRLWKHHTTTEEEDSIKALLVDYSVCSPFASMIRHDGRLKVDDRIWKNEDIAFFSNKLNSYLLNELRAADLASCCPPINPTKSTGFNTRMPDGKQFKKDQLAWFPKDFHTDAPNNLYRYNTAPIKEAWLKSGRVLENLKYFLDNCDNYDNPEILYKAFLMEAVAVHCEAYRTNNYDVPQIEFNGDFNKSRNKGYKKNREFSKEVIHNGDLFWLNSKLDDLKFETEQRKHFANFSETSLKKRPMFPANNASFMISFILLFRLFLHRIEDGSTGFPSNRDVVLERYQRIFLRHENERAKFVTFDRKTSEQFITDNFDKVLKMFQPKLRRVIKGLGYAILPSLYGPRVICGGLCSGTAQTTFLNSMVGLFEMSNCVQRVCQCSFETACEAVLSLVFDQKDYLTINGIDITCNLGTDDQILIVWDDRSCAQLSKDLGSYFEERSLGGEVVEKCTVFGMDFSNNGVCPSTTLGLAKVFLMEKTVNGDAMALKMRERLKQLGNYYDDIQETFNEFKFGSLKSYDKGAENALRNLSKYGFPIEGLFNEHSPVENLIYGDLLKNSSFANPLSRKKYTEEQMEPLYKELVTYFGV